MKFKKTALILAISLIVVGCSKENNSGVEPTKSPATEVSGDEIPKPNTSFIDYLLTSDVGHKTIEEIGPVVSGLSLDFTIDEIYQSSKDYLIANGYNSEDIYYEDKLINSTSFEEYAVSMGDMTVDAEDDRNESFAWEGTPYDMPFRMYNLQPEDKKYMDVFNANTFIALIGTDNLGISPNGAQGDSDQIDVLIQTIEKIGLPTKIIFGSSKEDQWDDLLNGKSWYSTSPNYSDMDMKTSNYTLEYDFDEYVLLIGVQEMNNNENTGENTIVDSYSNYVGESTYTIERIKKPITDYYESYESRIIGEVNGIELSQRIITED